MSTPSGKGVPGWGRVERAVAAALAVPGSAYTTEDLVGIVYREAVPGKKHRVAVLRAAKRLCRRVPRYARLHRGGTGAQFVFFDRTSVESYAAALPKAYEMISAEAIERFTAPGGKWWKEVEMWRAEVAGDREAAEAIAAEIAADETREREAWERKQEERKERAIAELFRS